MRQKVTDRSIVPPEIAADKRTSQSSLGGMKKLSCYNSHFLYGKNLHKGALKMQHENPLLLRQECDTKGTNLTFAPSLSSLSHKIVTGHPLVALESI